MQTNTRLAVIFLSLFVVPFSASLHAQSKGKGCTKCDTSTLETIIALMEQQMVELQQDAETSQKTITELSQQIADLKKQLEEVEPIPDPEPPPPPDPPPPDPPIGDEDLVSSASALIAAVQDCPRRLAGIPIQLAPGTYNVNLSIMCDGTKIYGRTDLPPHQRVKPEDVAQWKLTNADGLTPTVWVKANNYELRGFTIMSPQPQFETTRIGDSMNKSLEQAPDNGTFNQMVILANPPMMESGVLQGGIRGVSAHARAMTLKNSHVAGFVYRGRDSQAFVCGNGPGPYIALNNYLEGSGENFICGGDTVRIVGTVPTGYVAFNHMKKLIEWKRVVKDGVVVQAGFPGSVKNLIEFKNARDFVVEWNVFENNWADAQEGSAVLFTPRNQYGDCTWCVVENIVFRHNHVKGSFDAFCFNILGHDYTFPSGQTKNITLENNLLEDCRNGIRSTRGITERFVLRSNTWPHIRWNWVLFGDSPKIGTLVVENEVIKSGEYGYQGGALPNWVTTLEWAPAGPNENIVERTDVRWISWPAGTKTLTPGAFGTALSSEFRHPEAGYDHSARPQEPVMVVRSLRGPVEDEPQASRTTKRASPKRSVTIAVNDAVNQLNAGMSNGSIPKDVGAEALAALQWFVDGTHSEESHPFLHDAMTMTLAYIDDDQRGQVAQVFQPVRDELEAAKRRTAAMEK